MTRRGEDFDEEEEDSFDDERWDADEENDPDGDTLPCPYCGAAIYDDAVQCSACGEYLSREERKTPTQSKWVIVTATILLVALAIAFLR